MPYNHGQESLFRRFSSRPTWAEGNYHHKVDFTSSRGRKGMLHFAAPRTNIRPLPPFPTLGQTRRTAPLRTEDPKDHSEHLK